MDSEFINVVHNYVNCFFGASRLGNTQKEFTNSVLKIIISIYHVLSRTHICAFNCLAPFAIIEAHSSSSRNGKKRKLWIYQDPLRISIQRTNLLCGMP